jgi:tetratricopeptide (TPR) repeat protein
MPVLGKSVFIIFLASTTFGVLFRWATEPKPSEQIKSKPREEPTDPARESRIRRVLQQFPDNADARFLLAMICWNKREPEKALVHFQKVPRQHEKGVDALLFQGDIWQQLGYIRHAEKLWHQAHTLAPQRFDIRGRMLISYGVSINRREWLSLLWDFHDDGQAGFRELIQLLIADEVVFQTDDAMPLIREYLSHDPDDSLRQMAMAQYLLMLGQVDEAKKCVDHALQCEDAHADTWLAALSLAGGQRDVEWFQKIQSGMSRDVEQACRSHPTWSHARGQIELATNNLTSAESMFQNAVSKMPYHSRLQTELASTLRLLGKDLEADRHSRMIQVLAAVENIMQNMATKKSWTPEEVVELSRLLLRIGMVEEARAWLRFALSHHPNHSPLKEQFDKAWQAPTTSSRTPPKNPYAGLEVSP